MISRLRLAASAVAWATAAPAMAQSADAGTTSIVLSQRDPTTASIFEFDFGVPTSPALTLAGASPDKTTTSASLKPFVLALPSLLDGSDGGQSVALDVAPAAAFWRDQTIERYRSVKPSRRAWARSRLGLALVPGIDADKDTDDKPSRIALGYSTSLLDHSDPYLVTDESGESVWSACTKVASQTYFDAKETRQAIAQFRVNRGRVGDDAQALYAPFRDANAERRAQIRVAQRAALDRVVLSQRSATSSQLSDEELLGLLKDVVENGRVADAGAAERNSAVAQTASAVAVEAAFQACAKEATAAARAARDLDFGFGVVWSGQPGQFDGFSDPGGAVWVAYKHPLMPATKKEEFSLAAGGSVRHAWRESVASGDATTPSFLADTTDAWVGLEAATNRLRFTAQYGWFEADAREAARAGLSHSGTRYLLGASLAVLGEENGVWANVSYGSAAGTIDARDDETLLVTLTFAPPKDANIFGFR